MGAILGIAKVAIPLISSIAGKGGDEKAGEKKGEEKKPDILETLMKLVTGGGGGDDKSPLGGILGGVLGGLA